MERSDIIRTRVTKTEYLLNFLGLALPYIVSVATGTPNGTPVPSPSKWHATGVPPQNSLVPPSLLQIQYVPFITEKEMKASIHAIY